MATDKLPWGLKAKGLAPGSMKNISENKLKAFNIGSMNIVKGTSKKEQEDMRKKREEEEAAEAYKAFVESFDDSDKGLNRSWVKGGIVNPEKGEEKAESGLSRLYKPTSKIVDKKVPALQSTKQVKLKEEEKPERPNKPTPTPQRLWTPTPVETGSSKKKTISSAEKRKTNLELFKEELKVIQEERQERRKVRQELGIVEDNTRKTRFDPPEPVATGVSLGIKPAPTTDDYRLGSYNYDNDTQTTNIYLGNINPKMTEMQLCEIFGKFGPLASVKVMWPRTEEEKARGRNCGFVAYMNRKDGERAMNSIQGKDIMDFEMKLGWGKAVPIPPHPIYIPPALTELTQPPPPSGLPFNAQPLRPRNSRLDRDDKNDDPDKMLANAIVKVVIPTERNLLNIIHRMVEFVVREGPMFEAMIMNRELQNPMFRFLFENQSPAHVYYRWKLFSILQGDSPFRWRTEEFCMFKSGSIWRPPQMNPYSQGMPDELVEGKSEPTPVEETPKKGGLTDGQRDRLEDMLRDLIPERAKIGDCMVWCLDHAESAEEVVECIAESLSILQTPIPKKIARLFLISDILHNCSARVAHASYFRRYFEAKLPEIFKDIHESYEKIDARLKAEQFKQKVMACFRAWEDWAVYTSDFLINLQNIFLGLVPMKSYDSPQKEEEDLDGMAIDDVDGVPLDELDGAPIDGEPDGDNMNMVKGIVPYGDDLDGEPVVEPKKPEVEKSKPAFVPSKWETVDESELEKQAMTVSKWDLLDQQRREEEAAARLASSKNDDFQDDDIDGKPLDEDEDSAGTDDLQAGRQKNDTPSWHVQDDSTADSADTSRNQQDLDRTDEDRMFSQLRQGLTEDRRAKLREIELKVMKYQDELEAGKRSRKPGMSISEQVDHYRRKQLRKEEEKEKDDDYDRHSKDRERDRGRGRDRGRDDDRYGHEDDEDSSRDDSYRNDRDSDRINDRSSSRRHRDRKDSDDERSRDEDRREAQQRNRDHERGETSRAGRDSGIDRGSSYREDKRYRESGSERSSRDGGAVAGQAYQDSNADQRDLYYSADRSYSGDGERYRAERNHADHRDESVSPNRGDCSGASSYVDPSSGPSPLVSYARSQSSDSPRTLDDDDDDDDVRSSHRRKRRHRSPKKSSKSGSPRRVKRSRSRSPNRHKHKKSRRS